MCPRPSGASSCTEDECVVGVCTHRWSVTGPKRARTNMATSGNAGLPTMCDWYHRPVHNIGKKSNPHILAGSLSSLALMESHSWQRQTSTPAHKAQKKQECLPVGIHNMSVFNVYATCMACLCVRMTLSPRDVPPWLGW